MMTKHGKLSFVDKKSAMSNHHAALSRSWSGGGASSYLSQHMISPTSPVQPSVLGHKFQSPKVNRRPMQSLGTSFKKATKIPKVPRPNRALLIFENVCKGIRECIQATEEDVEMLRTSENPPLTSSSTAQGKLYELDKQIKAAERYQKRLEFHLAKVEELHDNYVLQQQLREGVRNMARAYGALSSTNKRDSLAHVKYGYKECTQTMCAIEAQLENMMGTFHCKMKGLVGFARLCPGDVFEVAVRHGTQKWKTKGRMASSAQNWENDTIVFKSLLGDILSVKAIELRGLGKTVVLGQKNCESKDLFSSHPQMMTISINSNGSLKLRIIVTWNPLEGIDENVCYFEPPPKMQNTPKKKFATSPIMRDTKDPLFVSAMNMKDGVHLAQFETEEGLSPSDRRPLQRPLSAAPDLAVVQETSPQTIGSSGSADFTSKKPHLFDMRLLAESLVENTTHYEASSLEDALHNFRLALEDYQGQYPELRNLEEQVIVLDRMIRKNCGAGSSRSSDVSISIESALGAFDFLESEDGLDFFDFEQRSTKPTNVDHFTETLSPDSTTKTTDSGIESLTNQLNGERNMASSGGSSPEPLSSGNEAVDQALIYHLLYCERLLESLGNFGPLKCKEIYSLDKLKTQSFIIESLITIAKKGSQIVNLQEAMNEQSVNQSLHEFWTKMAGVNTLLVDASHFYDFLQTQFNHMLTKNYDIPPNKVFRVLISRILDIASYDPEASSNKVPVTMPQFMTYFTQLDVKKNLAKHLEDLAGELWITSRLKSGSVDVVIKTLLTFGRSIPPAECLRVLALLLITNNGELTAAAEKYIKGICDKANQRDKAMIVFVEALEDQNADVRCAACIALGLLQARESTDQLVYIAQTDVSRVVKVKAKESLFLFGEEGRKAFYDSELTTHGFQGIRL